MKAQRLAARYPAAHVQHRHGTAALHVMACHFRLKGLQARPGLDWLSVCTAHMPRSKQASLQSQGTKQCTQRGSTAAYPPAVCERLWNMVLRTSLASNGDHP